MSEREFGGPEIPDFSDDATEIINTTDSMADIDPSAMRSEIAAAQAEAEAKQLALEARGRERVDQIKAGGTRAFNTLRTGLGNVLGGIYDRVAKLALRTVGRVDSGVEATGAGIRAAGNAAVDTAAATAALGFIAAEKTGAGAKAAGAAIDSGARALGNKAIDAAATVGAVGFMAAEGIQDRYTRSAAVLSEGWEATKLRGAMAYVAAGEAKDRAIKGGKQMLYDAGTSLEQGIKNTYDRAEGSVLDIVASGLTRWEALKARVSSARDTFNGFVNRNRLVRGEEIARERAEARAEIDALRKQVEALLAMQSAKAEAPEAAGA